jgi:hypothetical protein
MKAVVRNSTATSRSCNTRKCLSRTVHDVLVKVRAAACTYNDIWARRGLPGMLIILPHSGSDVAGESPRWQRGLPQPGTRSLSTAA